MDAGEEQGYPRFLRQVVQPCAHEPVEAFRNGQGVRRVDMRPERAGDLERVERVPAGGLMEAEQRRPGENPSKPQLDEPLQGAGAERANGDALDTVADRLLERRCRGTDPDATGEQQADPDVGQPPQRERERALRRRVEPLDVVDRDEHRLAFGEHLECSPDRHGHRPEVDRGVLRLAQEQSDLERAPSGARELRGDVGKGLLEQVSERGVGNAAFELTGSRGQHAEAVSASRLCSRRPQRRLADAGLALEHECRGRVLDRAVEEGLDRAELVVPANHVHRQLLGR